jgi:hypothetical protein
MNEREPPLSLIPVSALNEEALALAHDTEGQGLHVWRNGGSWKALIDSALYHILAFNEGEDIDPKSSLLHLGHARAYLGMLIEYTGTKDEFDDRHTRVDSKA